MPRAALVLGYSGLLPVVAALVTVLLRQRVPGLVLPALIAEAFYAALILSFLGGMWWGQASRTGTAPGWVYAVAVLPTLVGLAIWGVTAALRDSLRPAEIGIGLAVLATLPIDTLLVRAGIAPAWWMRLRVPLSLGLGLGTMLVGILAGR